MASGQQRFEDEDWLGSYLSSSKYASDPKLSSEPKPKAKFGLSFGSKNTPSPATSASSTSGAAAAPQDPSSGYNLAAQSRSSNRRRSWAAPPGMGVPGAGHRANPAEAAAAKAIAAAQAAASSNPPATTLSSTGGHASTGGRASSTTSSGYAIPPPPFPEHGHGDISAALQVAAAKVVNSASVNARHPPPATGKRGAPLPGYAEPGLCSVSQSEWHEELTDKASNFRRKSFSGSGRRVSLDYTDLEAVKERVQQAASLWAVAEDAERESLSSNEAGSNSKAERAPGPRSAAAQAMAAAQAIKAGEMTMDDDDESTDDEMDEEEEEVQKVPRSSSKGDGQAKNAPAPSQTAAAPPAKKGSLIKKWLVFKK